MRTKEHTQKVLNLFSQHCKSQNRGKVFATKALAMYFYRQSNPESARLRERFCDNWESLVETIIYKPNRTVLSNPKYDELFDIIDTYISETEPEKYLDVFNDDILSKLYESLILVQSISCSKPEQQRFNVGTIYSINTPLFDMSVGTVDEIDEYIGFYDYYDGSSENGIYKFVYLKFDASITTENDPHKLLLKGIVLHSQINGVDNFFGFVFDQESNTICPLLIGNHKQIDVYTRGLESVGVFFEDEHLFFKIYGREALFNPNEYAPKGTCIQAIIFEKAKTNLPESDISWIDKKTLKEITGRNAGKPEAYLKLLDNSVNLVHK